MTKDMTISQTAKLLQRADNILIFTHVRPDGDTAGSGCALCLGLRQLGKTAYLAENTASMERYNEYLTPYFAPTGFVPAFTVAVDTPGAGQYPPHWRDWAEKTDLAIDHHGTNGGYARYTLLEPDSAATGELVYLVLQALKVTITPAIAQGLYVALATDTNGFRTAGTTGRTLTIAGALHDVGFDVFGLTRQLFETKTRARLGIETYLFSTMTFPREGVCLMVLPRDVIDQHQAGENDLDKISLLTMTAENTWAGIFLRELDPGQWKLSLRTDGTVNAGVVFRELGGGGHPDAAGAVLTGDAQGLAQRVLTALDKQQEQGFNKKIDEK
jgi:phosphoesterase RecJ-like protein